MTLQSADGFNVLHYKQLDLVRPTSEPEILYITSLHMIEVEL